MLQHKKTTLILPITHPNKKFIPQFQQKDLQLRDMYDFIQMLTKDDSIETFRFYEYNASQYTANNEQQINQDTIFTHLYTKNFAYRFRIPEISLALFDSGVGFLNFQIEYTDYTVYQDVKDIEEIDLSFFSSLNYCIKRIMRTQSRVLAGDELFPFSQFIESFLATAELEYHYGNGEHLLLYTSAHLKDAATPIEVVKEYAYRLAYNYKYTYTVESERYSSTSDSIFQPFQNVVWAIGHEGLSNLTIETEQHETNYFFNGYHQQNLQSVYFYLYLLALYQKYSLLNYTSKNNHLLSQMKHYSNKERLAYVKNTRHEVLQFSMKGLFYNISFNSHHAELYKIIRLKLDIEKLHEELNDELLSMNQLIESYVQEEEALKNQRATKQKNKQALAMQLLTFGVMPLTIFSTLNSLKISAFQKYFEAKPLHSFVVIYALFILLYFILKNFNLKEEE